MKRLFKKAFDAVRNVLLWIENQTTLYPELDPHYDIAVATASEAKGDCDDKTAVAEKYLKARGLPYKFQVGKHKATDKMWHAWLEVWQDGNRYILDPSAGQRGWMFKNPERSYLVSPEYTQLYEAAKESEARMKL